MLQKVRINANIVRVNFCLPFRYINYQFLSLEIRGTLPGISWTKGLALKENGIGWDITLDLEANQKFPFQFVAIIGNDEEKWIKDDKADGFVLNKFGTYDSLVNTDLNLANIEYKKNSV